MLASEPLRLPVDDSLRATGNGRAREWDHKLSIIRTELDHTSARAAALSTRRNFAWATGGGDNHVILSSDDGVATIVITERDVTIVSPENEAQRIRDEEIGDLDVEVVGVPWHQLGAVEAEIARLSGGRCVRDADLESRLRVQRMMLNQRELQELTALGALATRAMTHVLNEVVPGDLETLIAARLTSRLAAEGVRTPVVLAASDHRIAAYRHPIPKPKPIERSLMLVVCAERQGLIVALTRFLLFERPGAELARRFDAVARIQGDLQQATHAGVSLGELFEGAIAAYAREGFPAEVWQHHQGGPVGYQPREEFATPGSRAVVRPGMAFAWNPSIAGAKSEDTFIHDGAGARTVVTNDPRWPATADGRTREWVRDG